MGGTGYRKAIAVALAGVMAPPVSAQQSLEGAPQLERIVVTGEKTERSLEETAASVSVIDSRALTEDPSLNSTNSVLEGIPNLSSSGTSNLAPAVRGIDGTGPAEGGDAFIAGTRPRLGFQVDGRAASYNEIVFGDFSTWDVRQVEIFRGAQSLLQGRNSLAGAVVVRTNDPIFEREVGARVMVGNYGQRQYAAVLNTPLLEDELALRVAVDRRLHDSFEHGLRAYPGVSDPGEYQSETLRAKLLLQPKALPGFTTLATFTHSDNLAPQYELVRQRYSDKVAAYPHTETFRTRTNSGSLETTWRLNERITLENHLSYGDFHIARTALAGQGNIAIDGRDFSWEPRVRLSGAATRGFAGLYYYRTRQDEFIDMAGGASFDDKAATIATYGEVTHDLRADLHLTFGVRYEEERRRRQGRLFASIDLDETYRALLPKVVLAWDATPGLSVGAGVSRGYNGGGAGVAWSSGEAFEYDAEYAWTYEGFTRARLFDGKVLVNANVFYSEYKDIQLPFDTDPGPDWATVIRNAERAATYGAELDAKWLLTHALQLNAGVGLLKTRIRKFGNNPELEGNELARSPALTATFGVQYRSSSGLEAGVNARYSQSYYSEVLNLARGKIDPYWIVNTRVAYNFGAYRLFAFVNNLLDEDAPILISVQSGTVPADDNAVLVQPRMIGAGVEAWF